MNQYFADTSTRISKMERRHSALSRQAAAEGIVLLENRNLLPLNGKERLALFGSGARQTLICGLGAASMNYKSAVSVEEGLENAGFSITSRGYLEQASALLDEEQEAYYDWLREQGKKDLLQGVLAMYSHPFVQSAQRQITEKDISEKADMAVFVISHCSGEGADRKNMPGDYQLLEDEKKNLQFLDEHFSDIIVLLNTVGVIDTKFIRGLKHLKALLFIGLGGVEAGNAVADVLLGKTAPQGKLTATWAENYEDYPNASAYAEMNGNVDDEMYTEGIYVGYRYFDSFGIRPAYPFGYGKTYADFRLQMTGMRQDGSRFFIRVKVTNESREFPGREVAQVYVSAPAGAISRAYQSLAGYAKTEMLCPGEAEELEIELDIKSMASYDEKKAAWLLEAGDYILRVGNSSENTEVGGILRLEETVVLEQCRNLFQTDAVLDEWKSPESQTADGWKSPESQIADEWKNPESQIADECKNLDDRCERIDLSAESELVLSVDTSYFKTKTDQYRQSDASGKKCHEDSGARIKTDWLTYTDVREGKISLDAFVDSLSLDELAHVCVGNVPEVLEDVSRASVMAAGTAVRSDAAGEDFLNPVVPGASETAGALQKERRIPKLNLADGGSGIRLVPEFELDEDGQLLTSGLFSIRGVERFMNKKQGERLFADSLLYYQYTTALPMALVLAQTWDEELLGQCGEMIGREMTAFGVDLWLAPSMNIHRNPLCGRNYEYYSEDPLVTGICGSAMVHGVQLYRGVGATIKHLACNNQEANRGATNAHVSERALREIYLRGYERVIRREKPLGMMTSLNLINGVHAANSYDLLTAFARDECGFDGFVMTDWGTTVSDPSEKTKYSCSSVAGCIYAGNDLIMPGTISDIEGIKAAVCNETISIRQLRGCVKNILRVTLRMDKLVRTCEHTQE